MKKLFSIILCLLVLCMALCACGRDDSVGEMASEAISDVETQASEIFSGDNNGEVNDGDGYIGNEATSGDTDNNNDSALNNNGSAQNNNDSAQNNNDSSENSDDTNNANSDMM